MLPPAGKDSVDLIVDYSVESVPVALTGFDLPGVTDVNAPGGPHTWVFDPQNAFSSG